MATVFDWRPTGLETRQLGRLTARSGGSAGVPVVLLHGLAASSDVWGLAWDRLAGEGLVLAPDLLGFGRSPRTSASHRLQDHADAVADAMLAAETTRPAVVVGHSFGALVALALARHHPELVGGLVLLAPPLHANAAEARRRVVGSLSRVERVIGMDNLVAQCLCRSLCTGWPAVAARLATWLRPELPRPIARAGVLHSWPSYSQSLAELLGARARPEWLGELAVPVRILAGDRDRCIDRDLLTGLGDLHGHVEVEVLAGLDHLLPLEAPGLCVARVEAMRSEVDDRGRGPGEGSMRAGAVAAAPTAVE